MGSMRGSDGVDLFLGLAPQWARRALVVGLVLYVAATGNAAPVMWYVHDKAAGVTEVFEGVLADYLDSLTQPTAPSHQLAKPRGLE